MDCLIYLILTKFLEVKYCFPVLFYKEETETNI